MQFINWLTQFAPVINQIWLITIVSMFVLYIVCNVLPDSLVGNILPLHNVFKPKMNIDLDYQSIGYAMLHTSWFAKITHSTMVIEALLWFVIFEHVHWSISYIVLFAILIQAVLIGDKKFGLFFILMGIVTFVGARYCIQLLGLPNAVLVSKVILMLGGFMRMLSHSAELIPPLLLDKTDQFVKLSPKNVNWKIPLSSIIGYVAEFSSSLPNRLLPVHVNYLYQNVLGLTPEKTLPWHEVVLSAQKALKGGYSKVKGLRVYYDSVVKN